MRRVVNCAGLIVGVILATDNRDCTEGSYIPSGQAQIIRGTAVADMTITSGRPILQ